MPRYQFQPRANCPAIDLDRADAVAFRGGAKHIRKAYPMMGSKGERQWRGTNQPRTIAFTCEDDSHALAIANAYGLADAFVCNITDWHYV